MSSSPLRFSTTTTTTSSSPNRSDIESTNGEDGEVDVVIKPRASNWKQPRRRRPVSSKKSSEGGKSIASKGKMMEGMTTTNNMERTDQHEKRKEETKTTAASASMTKEVSENHTAPLPEDDETNDVSSYKPIIATTKENSAKRQKKRKQRKRKQQKRKPAAAGVATSSWLKLTGIPPMASLDDVVWKMERVMELESRRGIIDLDRAEEEMLKEKEKAVAAAISRPEEEEKEKGKSRVTTTEKDGTPVSDTTKALEEEEGGSKLPLYSIPTNIPLIRTAKLLLSPYFRPMGYELEFPSRSVVHAILSHANESDIVIGGRTLLLQEHFPPVTNNSIENNEEEEESLSFDDACIRIEHCPSETRAEHLRHWFGRRYDLAPEGRVEEGSSSSSSSRTIQCLIEGGAGRRKHHRDEEDDDERDKPVRVEPRWKDQVYMVRFRDGANARAAVREMQGEELLGQSVVLVQFPRQIVS